MTETIETVNSTYGVGTVWFVLIVLALATFFLRFSFLGFIGNRPLPDWLLRHLRYTPVAVLPGLVAPLVIWPNATGGQTDPARLAAALVTLGVGYMTKSVLAAILSGATTLFALIYLLS